MALIAIKYDQGSLQLLDQRLLPFNTVYLDVPSPKVAWQHIKDMVVRGAPAIGVTGALALAVHLINGGRGSKYSSVAECVGDIANTLDYLVTSRPTAVNLADSATKLKAVAAEAAAAADATPTSVVEVVVAAAEATLEEDIAANKLIGAYGATALLAAANSRRPGGKVRVLTHCNTGSLATAAYGTALGVVRALHEQGVLEHAYCTETRPYNQGARLTAFELVHDGLPATLICDSAAAALMKSGAVDAVVVGADRVVANGDSANKIGTYSLSLAAAAHGIPFFIAAPTTTLDAALDTGDEIEIEQRPPEEVTHFKGQRVVVDGIEVWNPSFDVAPGRLIHGIITELGVVPRDASGEHGVRAFMADHGLWTTPAVGAAANGAAPAAEAAAAAPPSATAAAAAPSSSDGAGPHHAAMTVSDIKSYIQSHPELMERVGPPETAADWVVREVGDGNINFVYLVEGPTGGLVVKHSLPFVRCVGESWPLSQDRCRIEALALQLEFRLAPAHVPQVYRYEQGRAVIAMEYLSPPSTILRHAIVAGRIFPRLADHVSTFLATTLFHTSLLALDTGAFREQVSAFVNPDLCDLTAQVVFTDPYIQAANNRWTSPQLDADAAALRSDVQARVAATELKELFLGKTEALLHGDLHTGSIMVTESESRMIDPEFAYVGPMAFDVAKILGELLISYFASDGHDAAAAASADGSGSRAAQRAWLLSSVVDIWDGFLSKFIGEWNAHVASAGSGALNPAALVGSSADAAAQTLAALQAAWAERVLGETIKFAGAIIIRRLVGIAHTADMAKIADADVRATCERRALRFGRHLLVEGATLYKLGGWGAIRDAAVAGRALDGLAQ